MGDYTGHRRKPNRFWMRAVSFAALQRILKVISEYPDGVTAGEINKLVLKDELLLTQYGSPPAPTTLYHYRNTLIQLRVLNRDGRLLRVNDNDPDVNKLVNLSSSAEGDQFLRDDAKELFASMVFKNVHCKTFFFDVFAPTNKSVDSICSFRQNGLPVKWSHRNSADTKEVVFQNTQNGSFLRCTSHASIAAVLYGVRYWARDELGLIDEYYTRSDGNTVMFPVFRSGSVREIKTSSLIETVSFVLSLRSDNEWTTFSIFDLIVQYCVGQKRSIRVLFNAIDWLSQNWPHHTALIPTSQALATLTESSARREKLALRNFYRTSSGPYISHIRIHKDIVFK